MAGKSHFCRYASVAGKAVRVSDGDEVVAARRGWGKDWRKDEKSKAKQYRAMYEAYVEHALEYPRIPLIGSAARGGLPALAAYYGCIVLKRASILQLEVGAARRWMAATAGGTEHPEWAGRSVEHVRKRIEDAYTSQNWYASQVDYAFDTWKELADKLSLHLPTYYTEEISEKDKDMAQKMWGTLTIGGESYKVHGDQAAIDKAREILAAPKSEVAPAGVLGQDAKPPGEAAPPAEPKPLLEGDMKRFSPKKQGPLPDPDRWTGVQTPQAARK
jgi:hypothetical protein